MRQNDFFLFATPYLLLNLKPKCWYSPTRESSQGLQTNEVITIHELQRLAPGAWKMIQSVCVRPLVWAYTQANWLGCWNSGPWNGWLCPLSNSKIPRGWVLNWNNGTCIHVNSQLAYRATRCYVWAYTQTLRLAALFKHANGWRCPLSNSELEPANGLKIP